jgi:hypothetical protein
MPNEYIHFYDENGDWVSQTLFNGEYQLFKEIYLLLNEI